MFNVLSSAHIPNCSLSTSQSLKMFFVVFFDWGTWVFVSQSFRKSPNAKESDTRSHRSKKRKRCNKPRRFMRRKAGQGWESPLQATEPFRPFGAEIFKKGQKESLARGVQSLKKSKTKQTRIINILVFDMVGLF